MEIKFSKEGIEFEKEINALDQFVIDFTSILDKLKIEYVLISGYVSILFGRSRSSEDIDILVEELSIEKFSLLWKSVTKDFECIITDDVQSAYTEYLTNGAAIRFARKGEFIPNIEVKFPKNILEKWAMDEKKRVIINNQKIFISPLELQVSFKVFLGSEKDIEDAMFLYKLFIDHLDMQLLHDFNRKLKIEDQFNKYITKIK